MFETENYNIYCNDCIEQMQQLIPKNIKIDLVLVDMPYGVSDCTWDSLIPFDKMWDCLDKLSHNTTNFLFFGVEPFSTYLRMSNIDIYRYDLYWSKNRCTGFLHAKNKPLTSIELISVFSNGFVNHKQITNNRMTYNPQGLKIIEQPKTAKSRNESGSSIYNKSSFKEKTYIPKYTNYPRQLIHFDSLTKTIHPTQKPVKLLEYLIKTYSNEGDTVLDFTMGSGSTGVACMNTNRKFIGIELEEEYYQIAKERLQDCTNHTQTTLM